MKLIDLLRAKSEGQESLLFKEHIIEALQRAKQLKNFIDANKESIKCQQLKDIEFFEALATAIILHDLGKVNYEFQKMVYDKASEEWEKVKEFLKVLRNVNLKDHEVLSSIWASILLDNSEWNAKIRTAVLLHHYNGYFVNEKDLMGIVEDYRENIMLYLKFLIEKKDEIDDFLNDLLNEINEKFEEDFIKSAVSKIQKINVFERAKDLLEKIENREDDISEFADFYNINNENPDYDFMLFLGCLRRCDYSASGGVDLELEKINNMEDVYTTLKERIKTKVKSDSLWQENILEKIDPLKPIVLVAPTGSGKTEFALLWAEKNNRKLIYTLPLRVALNDLFFRFREADHAYFEKEFVDVLHSTAFIEYLGREKVYESGDIEKKLTAAKLLSSPILLTTPDQVFLTSLNYYGSDKVLAVYPLSSIVIDEVQTYDEEMASIIVKTLQIVQKLGGVVIVMTATLPPYFEPFLKSEVDFTDLQFDFIDLQDIKENVKNYNIKRHKIKVVDKALVKYVDNDKKDKELKKGKKDIDISDELELWLDEFKDKNMFIVVNNVSKAIAIYEWLKNKDYPNIFLLHSRLIEKEKSRRIKLIKELIKPNKNEEEISKLKQEGEKINPDKPAIVVATQIIEASVDLDFDAMITEISTIDSQIQRWGRVYRNKDQDYNKEEPNIVIFAGEQEEGKTKIDKGTKAIYDKKVIEKTIEVLKEFEGKVLNYDDERAMVNEVFNREVEVEGYQGTLKDFYIKKIRENLDFLKYFTVEKKSQAQRVFRRIAGIQVVIPEIMKHYGDELTEKFAEIVENLDLNKITWEEIVDELNKKLSNGLNKIETKWMLKKILYEYSINIPVFYWEGGKLSNLRTHEFKGFQVLKLSREQAEEVYWYGIDKILKKEEEEVYFDNII